VIRTSLLAVSCCLALLRGALCSTDDGPCEYEVTLLDPDEPTPSGMTVGDEFGALEGTFSGTWRWYASTDELTIEGGGVEFPAQATFILDPATYRISEHVGGGAGAFCGDRGIRVDGTLTFADEQDAVILSIPITVDRRGNQRPNYVASMMFSPISEFSPRLHENVEYDESGVSALVRWIDGQLVAEFHYGGQSMLTPQTGAGILRDVAEFE
jgi:hypothetical protein